MKNKKWVFWLIAFTAALAALFLIFRNQHTTEENFTSSTEPFQISVTDLKVSREPKQVVEGNDIVTVNGEETRFAISVSIENSTDRDFQNVWFELQLNPEVEPYIASKILKFTSDKMDVTTEEKARMAGEDPPEGPPVVCGFSHGWNMMLTPEDELRTYYMLTPDGFEEALKSIAINVYWDGGSQNTTIPLHLNNSLN